MFFGFGTFKSVQDLISAPKKNTRKRMSSRASTRTTPSTFNVSLRDSDAREKRGLVVQVDRRIIKRMREMQTRREKFLGGSRSGGRCRKSIFCGMEYDL